MPLTPCFLLYGHLNLYLPIQNLATFTTILFSPHKHIAHHNAIPNSATYIHLHTPTHGNTSTKATLFFSFSPNNSTQWISVILKTWWNSTTCYEDQHITQQQHNIPTCSLSCWLFQNLSLNGSLFWSNNIFFNDLCHYIVFSIGEFPANIYTFITHGL